ncbi:MAG: hypothetical protein AAFQ43_06670 [Bacteroidota bacterium]
MRAFPIALLTLALASGVRAQPDIVPAEHGVYPFLLDQRTAGHLPEYRHEVLPLARGTVLAHLDSLDARGRLGRGAARWAAAFRRELAPPPEAVHAWVGDGDASRADLGAERFLTFSSGEEGTIRVRASGGIQSRLSRGLSPTHETLPDASGTALFPELTMSGDWRGLVGVISQTWNGLQVTGDTRVLRADPELEPLYYIGIADEPPGTFDRSTASLRVARGPLSAEIANARLRIGPSPSQPLILASGVDYFPFARLGFELGPVRYGFVHAALSDQSRFVTEDGDSFLTSPERYMAMHRVEVRGARFSAGFTEAVVYGLRGPELAYLNPLFPIKPAEHALWDRDNSLFALDAVVRPLAGVEVYGTYLADDLSFSRIGEEVGNNNKWALQAGASAHVLGATVYGEYTRIEPFVYTHRFVSDGSYFNSYTHNGFGLGHPLGPNADQWEAGGRKWLASGVRLEARARYARRGENPVDPDTGEVTQVGGDVQFGEQVGPLVKRFLAGDVFTGPGAGADVVWEPVNSLTTRLSLDWQSWDPGDDRFFVRFGAHLRL